MCHYAVCLHAANGCKPMAHGVTWNTNTPLQGLWQWVVCDLFWPADIHNDMRNGFCLHLSSHDAHVRQCLIMTS